MIRTLSHEFDLRSGQYEAHAPVQREMAAWLAEWLPWEMPGPALELGAGTGLFTRHIAQRSGQLLATDASPRMVAAGAKALPALDWIISDAERPLEGRNFQWILSCSLVQWLSDPARAFRVWHQAGASGATLIGGWFVRGTLGELLDVCPEAAPFAWRETEEWLQLLSSTGWQPLRHEEKLAVRRHRSASQLLREIHNAGAAVPRRLGTGVLRAALRRYDETHRNENEVGATFRFVRVEAVRA